ncbi:MAG: SRPBCC family protein, partial [Gammaproteobacteria bacterium]
MPVNWKIANDTFGENYHFASLHKNTLGNLLHSDVATYDEYGRNHRIVVASRYLDAMREQPESSWRITDGAVIAYYLFPNTQLVVLNGMLALARIFPHRKDVGKSITRVSHFALAQPAAQAEDTSGAQVLNAQNLYQADVSQRMEFTLEATAELFVSTVEHEDYYMGTKSQEAANSGLVEYFLFGRNEPALHHFHNNYRSALGQPPLAEYTP